MSRRGKSTIMFEGRLLLSPKELAKRTGYNVWHIRLLLREGKITGEKIGGEWWLERAKVISQLRNPDKRQAVEVDPLEGL